jgi:hypothetical protein
MFLLALESLKNFRQNAWFAAFRRLYNEMFDLITEKSKSL